MRILFVSSSKSGASSRLREYAYVHRTLQLEQHCRELGAATSLMFLGDLIFSSPVLIQPLNIPFVLRYLKRFDVINAEGNGAAYFLAWAKPLIGRNVLAVYDVHSDVISESRLIRKGRLHLAGYFIAFELRFTQYVAVKGIDYFVTAANRLKRRLLNQNPHIKEENVEVILNGADIKSFGPRRRNNCNIQHNDFTVTYAGSFPSYQGIENLIRAAELLDNESIHFKFIGFGKEVSEC